MKAVSESRGWVRRWSAWMAGRWIERSCAGRDAVRSCRVVLNPGEVVVLPRAAPEARIEVERGVVWLTGSPSDGDHLLSAGQGRNVSDRDGRVVVEALGTAVIRVVG